MKTIDIKGKAYVEVNERVKHFLKNYKDWSIETELLSNGDGVCVFKAIVKDQDGNVKATGHAYEKENSSYINKTSYIENCETSAVGRALGFLGIGIDASIASADEVINAMNNQKDSEPRQVQSKPETSKGIDFEGYRNKCAGMTVDELRKEYVLVNTNRSYSDKQKEALKKIIEEVQESKND